MGSWALGIGQWEGMPVRDKACGCPHGSNLLLTITFYLMLPQLVLFLFFQIDYYCNKCHLTKIISLPLS